jgi:hypothetical protein
MAEPLPWEKPYPIISETLEPTAAFLIGRMFARFQEAKKTGDRHHIESALMRMWWVVKGLNEIAIGVSTATHFTIAASNDMRRVAVLIDEELDVDPFNDPMWK